MRRLLALIRGLPPEAAVWEPERAERAGWGLTEELLANLIETVDRARIDIVRGTVEAAGGKLRSVPQPLRLEHPGRDRLRPGRNSPPPKTNWAEVAAFLGGNVRYTPN